MIENANDNLTLHSGGTFKHGHSYTTLDVKKEDDVLVVGLREVRGADVQSQTYLMRYLMKLRSIKKKRIWYQSYYKY